MKIEIQTPLFPGDLRKQAQSLKAEIESQLSIVAKTRVSANELKVFVNGKSIFSYKEKKRMPRPGEILGMIESRRTAS